VGDALELTSLAAALRDSPRLFGLVETLHLIAMASIVGAAFIVDLRLLGVSRNMSVRALLRHALPFSLAGFLVAVPTGLVMFTAHASDYLTHPAFPIKLALILAAGVNAGVFHTGVGQASAAWDTGAAPPVGARIAGALSLAFWIAVVVCGRLLQYR
jgi:hypothetical protein